MNTTHAMTSRDKAHLAVALGLAWALSGWAGAQATVYQIQQATERMRPASTDTLTQEEAAFIQSGGEAPQAMPQERMTEMALVPVDPFARPVEEEITDEVVRATDLSQEGGSVLHQIFSNQDQIERLLGANPSFVYNSGGMRDPMIIPWIRREYDMRQLMDRAEVAVAEGRFADALEAYHTVVNQYSGSRAAGEAAEAIARIESQVNAFAMVSQSGVPTETPVILPMEIRQGLTGILYEETNPNCLIGDNIYGVGETIPNFEVTILEIKQDAVVFLYREHEFTVPVVAN